MEKFDPHKRFIDVCNEMGKNGPFLNELRKFHKTKFFKASFETQRDLELNVHICLEPLSEDELKKSVIKYLENKSDEISSEEFLENCFKKTLKFLIAFYIKDSIYGFCFCTKFVFSIQQKIIIFTEIKSNIKICPGCNKKGDWKFTCNEKVLDLFCEKSCYINFSKKYNL